MVKLSPGALAIAHAVLVCIAKMRQPKMIASHVRMAGTWTQSTLMGRGNASDSGGSSND